jgi:hypothetical protein
MKDETIEDWVKVYETFEYMTASIIEGRLNDEGIETQTMNKADIGYTMEVGNSQMGRQAVNMPFKIFVKPDDVEKAKEITSEDWSSILDDPNINFDIVDPKIEDIDEIEDDDDKDQ